MLSEQLKADLVRGCEGMELVEHGPLLERLSHDQFNFSPLLQPRLQPCLADLVVRVRAPQEVFKVAALCYRLGVPLTARGAGTGNYGQSVPLHGGVVLDTSGLDQVRSFDSATGVLSAEPGCRLFDLDQWLQPKGWALRLAPSTWRTATLGGFIAGGSSGVGSLRWGLLRDPGNLLGLELVTVEAEPKLLQLGPGEAQALNHAYGTNGIFTAVTVPTAPWQDWQELVLELPNITAALALGEELSVAALEIDALCFLERQLAQQLPELPNLGSVNGDRLLLLASPSALPVIEQLTKKAGGSLLWQRPQWPPGGLLLRELCWNHTTLHLRTLDSNFTYQLVLLPEPELAFIKTINQRWPGWLFWHLERVRQQGKPRWVALPLFRWQGEEQFHALNQAMGAAGGLIFNAHALTVEGGGLGVVDADQVAAKSKYDPKGLLNPGKLGV
jgi:FAD/FMN-containing dehydrogenase